jgi:transcriptional regulator with XRE-family HTH domain
MQNTDPDLTEFQIVTKNFKRSLKEQKITYRQLAKEIGLSESGVKKILSAKDGSFQRLTQLCQAVGLSIYELIDDSQNVEVRFSEDQQRAFLNDRVLLQIYWLLAYERQSSELVQKKLNLTYKELFQRLRKLDALKLLRLLPKDRLQLPVIRAVNWAGEGEFFTKIYREWSRNLLESVAKPKTNPDEFFLLRYLPMTQNTYKEFNLALLTLEEEFIRRSIQEMKTKGSQTKHVRWMVVADRRSFV